MPSKNTKRKIKMMQGAHVNALTRHTKGGGSYNLMRGMPMGATRGQGGFFQDLWGNVKKFAPRITGAAASAMAGKSVGDGWDAGAKFAQSKGWGKYKKRITRGGGAYAEGGINDVVLASPVPSMHSSEESVQVHKIEYLGDVFTSTTAGAFKNTVFEFNPGVFLYWGKHLAALFQQWKLEGAMVYFKSRSSSYTATTTLGTVMICMDYNPHNTAFVNKQQMQETTGCVACSIDQNCTMGVECDPKMTVSPIKYVRTGALPAGEDSHLYDMGKLQIATSGCAANVNIGELYISYHLTYYKPKAQFGTELDTFRFTHTAFTSALPLGNGGVSSGTINFNSMGVTVNLTNQAITLPAGTSGKFLITSRWFGAAAVAVTYPIVTLTNAVAYPMWSGLTTQISPAAGVNSTTVNQTICFVVTEPGLPTVITFGLAGVLPDAAAMSLNLMISEINANTI